MKPLRILLYTPVVPTETGGVQAVYRRTADALAARGHAVVRAWPIDDPRHPEPAPRRWPRRGNGPAPGGVVTLRLPRLEDRTLPLGPLRPTPRGLLHAIDPPRRLLGVLRGFKPDVVDVHFPRGGTRFFAAARRRHGLVLSFHGSDLLRPLPGDAPRLPGLLAAADRVIAVSEDLAAWARAARPAETVDTSPIELIPNGVDLSFWHPPAGADAPPPTVVSVGRLQRVKGHDLLIRAFVAIRDRVPDARLVLVGDGPEEASLRGLVASLGLAKAVDFAGRLDGASTRDRLHAAAAAAMPSRSEGLPLALLEAMAAGVPAVVTRVGGMPAAIADPSVVSDQPAAGLVVEPEDPAVLAAGLLTLLTDPGFRARSAAAALVRSAAFSADAADRRHAEVLEAAAFSRPRRSRGR